MIQLLLISPEEFKDLLRNVQQEVDWSKSYKSREKLDYNYRTALLKIQVLEEKNKTLQEYIDADPETRNAQSHEIFKNLLKIYM